MHRHASCKTCGVTTQDFDPSPSLSVASIAPVCCTARQSRDAITAECCLPRQSRDEGALVTARLAQPPIRAPGDRARAGDGTKQCPNTKEHMMRTMQRCRGLHTHMMTVRICSTAAHKRARDRGFWTLYVETEPLDSRTQLALRLKFECHLQSPNSCRLLAGRLPAACCSCARHMQWPSL